MLGTKGHVVGHNHLTKQFLLVCFFGFGLHMHRFSLLHQHTAIRLGCAFLCCLVAPPVAAQLGQWTPHTSLRQVTDVATSDDGIWATTIGGVFHYILSTGEFERFTAADGLHTPDTSRIAYDAQRQAIWIGYNDGVLDRIDIESGTIRSFRDIARATQFSSQKINRLKVRGDSLFIATAFGLVIFDPDKNEVRDTYSRLGTIPAATPVFDVTMAPSPMGESAFWVATSEGLAYAPVNAVNLQDPNVWTVEQVETGGMATFALAYFNDALYVGSQVDLRIREASGTYRRLFASNNPVRQLITTEDRVLGVELFNLVTVESSGQARRLNINEILFPQSVQIGSDGRLWTGDLVEGLVSTEFPTASTTNLDVALITHPAGPFDNRFSDLVVDAEGSVWAGGPNTSGTGFYKRASDGTWTNYLGRFFTELQGRSRFTRIHADTQGRFWAASEGSGLVEVASDDAITVYTNANSTLRPAGGTSNTFIVGGAATDSDGTLWVTTRGITDPLHVLTPEGEWTALPANVGDGLSSSSTAYGDVFVDSFGQKWIIVRSETNFRLTKGLLVLDDQRSPTDPSDDTFRFFGDQGGSGQGLPSITVTSVVEDRDGLIWIGTDNGLAFLINNGITSQDPNARPIWPQRANRVDGGDPFLLRGLTINDLAVDPANRLWVAGTDGVRLIESQEGGYEVVEHFTTENSPLFSDEVISVAVDSQSGEVYFATDRGLISFRGDAIAPVAEAQDLLVYPNPVRITEGNTPTIFIEGLVDATDVRILTSTGEVVAQIDARGGRVRWDGRDSRQNMVPSGVYLVIAVGTNGGETAYGKVAVIR